MKYTEFVKEMFHKLPQHLQAKEKMKEIAKLWREKKHDHKRVKGGMYAGLKGLETKKARTHEVPHFEQDDLDLLKSVEDVERELKSFKNKKIRIPNRNFQEAKERAAKVVHRAEITSDQTVPKIDPVFFDAVVPTGKGLKRGRGRPKKVKAGDFIHDVVKIGKAAATGDIFGLGLEHKHKKEKVKHDKESKKVLKEMSVLLIQKGLKKHQKHKNIRCALEHVAEHGLNFADFKVPY